MRIIIEKLSTIGYSCKRITDRKWGDFKKNLSSSWENIEEDDNAFIVEFLTKKGNWINVFFLPHVNRISNWFESIEEIKELLEEQGLWRQAVLDGLTQC